MAERGDSLVQFAKDHITSIASQNLRLRYRRRLAHLIGIAKNKLARLERLFVGIGARNAAALNRRMADAVLESECLSFIRQSMTILAPDRCDARDLLVCLLGACERRFQLLRVRRECGDDDVDVSGSERLLPIFGTAFAAIAQHFGAGSHALLKLRRKAVERAFRHTQAP